MCPHVCVLVCVHARVRASHILQFNPLSRAYTHEDKSIKTNQPIIFRQISKKIMKTILHLWCILWSQIDSTAILAGNKNSATIGDWTWTADDAQETPYMKNNDIMTVWPSLFFAICPSLTICRGVYKLLDTHLWGWSDTEWSKDACNYQWPNQGHCIGDQMHCSPHHHGSNNLTSKLKHLTGLQFGFRAGRKRGPPLHDSRMPAQQVQSPGMPLR